MGRPLGKLGSKIITLPVGSVISVAPDKAHLVRYHARPIRKVKLRLNLRTGRRDVWLGEFFNGHGDKAESR